MVIGEDAVLTERAWVWEVDGGARFMKIAASCTNA